MRRFSQDFVAGASNMEAYHLVLAYARSDGMASTLNNFLEVLSFARTSAGAADFAKKVQSAGAEKRSCVETVKALLSDQRLGTAKAVQEHAPICWSSSTTILRRPTTNTLLRSFAITRPIHSRLSSSGRRFIVTQPSGTHAARRYALRSATRNPRFHSISPCASSSTADRSSKRGCAMSATGCLCSLVRGSGVVCPMPAAGAVGRPIAVEAT
jgi:hypothetical protein